ncbi:hypothetical protein SteCoe_9955 [Stentor coeruleus]|uniref:Uncharacterized protein n=1 Tax=Stentor coeruleus TaxID=5963 RepID=A0A1R2CGS0_9CILI|nr:hypothetical protein SteCoe_9955 [Stentor coeruleus]
MSDEESSGFLEMDIQIRKLISELIEPGLTKLKQTEFAQIKIQKYQSDLKEAMRALEKKVELINSSIPQIEPLNKRITEQALRIASVEIQAKSSFESLQNDFESSNCNLSTLSSQFYSLVNQYDLLKKDLKSYGTSVVQIKTLMEEKVIELKNEVKNPLLSQAETNISFQSQIKQMQKSIESLNSDLSTAESTAKHCERTVSKFIHDADAKTQSNEKMYQKMIEEMNSIKVANMAWEKNLKVLIEQMREEMDKKIADMQEKYMKEKEEKINGALDNLFEQPRFRKQMTQFGKSRPVKAFKEENNISRPRAYSSFTDKNSEEQDSREEVNEEVKRKSRKSILKKRNLVIGMPRDSLVRIEENPQGKKDATEIVKDFNKTDIVENMQIDLVIEKPMLIKEIDIVSSQSVYVENSEVINKDQINILDEKDIEKATAEKITVDEKYNIEETKAQILENSLLEEKNSPFTPSNPPTEYEFKIGNESLEHVSNEEAKSLRSSLSISKISESSNLPQQKIKRSIKFAEPSESSSVFDHESSFDYDEIYVKKEDSDLAFKTLATHLDSINSSIVSQLESLNSLISELKTCFNDEKSTIQSSINSMVMSNQALNSKIDASLRFIANDIESNLKPWIKAEIAQSHREVLQASSEIETKRNSEIIQIINNYSTLETLLKQSSYEFLNYVNNKKRDSSDVKIEFRRIYSKIDSLSQKHNFSMSIIEKNGSTFKFIKEFIILLYSLSKADLNEKSANFQIPDAKKKNSVFKPLGTCTPNSAYSKKDWNIQEIHERLDKIQDYLCNVDFRIADCDVQSVRSMTPELPSIAKARQL